MVCLDYEWDEYAVLGPVRAVGWMGNYDTLGDYSADGEWNRSPRASGNDGIELPLTPTGS